MQERRTKADNCYITLTDEEIDRRIAKIESSGKWTPKQRLEAWVKAMANQKARAEQATKEKSATPSDNPLDC